MTSELWYKLAQDVENVKKEARSLEAKVDELERRVTRYLTEAVLKETVEAKL